VGEQVPPGPWTQTNVGVGCGLDVGGLDVGGLGAGGLDVGGLDVGGLDVGGLDCSEGATVIVRWTCGAAA
jgi:hypothetical protein